MVLDFLKNISVNLQAAGPAAVMAIWIVGITVLGLFGEGPVAERAMTILAVTGGLIFFSLIQKM